MTGSVLLVRHASAGSRGEWNGDDRLRPLDETGQDQADELVRLLSRFEVDDIVTADHVRCVETVQPLSESIGVPHAGPAAVGGRLSRPRGGGGGADPQASAGPAARRSRAASAA